MAIPPSFEKLAKTRGSSEEGAVPKDTVILFAIGKSYLIKSCVIAYSKAVFWLDAYKKPFLFPFNTKYYLEPLDQGETPLG